MTLLEKDAAGVTVARMRATIWANTFYRISRKFQSATGQSLANGMKVMLYGGATYHINYGLSFNVGEIDPSYTMGDLERIRREILAMLQKEGIINANRSLDVSEPPLKVAVISSEKAAGYGDFMAQLAHNPLGVEFHTLLFPAVMQGEKTAASVLAALNLVEATSAIAGWDCVAIIRGGGSTTDMTGFDNLELARRVATFPIPVVVGIGHERDRCVLDEIACIRCKTPTAVAAWLIDSVAFQWQRATDLSARIATFAAERLRGEQIRLQSIETMIPGAVEARLNNARLSLQSLRSRLPLITQGATDKERAHLENIKTTLRLASRAMIEREDNSMRNIMANVRKAAETCLDRERTALDNVEKLINVLNPVATLKRGYSITRAGGKAITGPNDVGPDDVIETQTAAGFFTSKVVKTSLPAGDTPEEIDNLLKRQ